jgi:hypothetical protein
MALNLVFLGLAPFRVLALAEPLSKRPGPSHCAQFSSSFRFENTSVIAASYFHHGDEIALPGMHPTCQSWISTPYANATTDLCRLVINITTTETTSTIVEGWLPSNWNRRILHHYSV